MINATFEKYEGYKDSGIKWLGDIPAHWQFDRAKSMFDKKLRPISDSDGIVTAFRDGQVTLRTNRRTTGFTNALKEHGYQGVRNGDLVIHAMDAFAGAIGVSDSKGKSSPVYSIYTPLDSSRVYNPYYGLLLRQMALSGFVASLGKGIRERSSEFRHKEFSPLELPIPPLEEQKAIVDYLYEKTAVIDHKIALLTQKAEQYKQLKQALINQTVTRGLDKTAPLKDSGIEWLGQIPAHWEVKRLKDVAFIQYSNVDKKTHENETPVKLSNYVDVYKNNFIDSSLPFMEATANQSEIRRFTLKKQDVLVTKDSETAEDIANPALVIENLPGVLCGYHLAHIRTIENVLFGSFLFRLFQSGSYGFRFVVFAKGITRVGLSTSAFSDALTPVPPFAEQKAIAEYLDAKTAHIDRIIATINRQIETLRELRKTLINDVVTGKIKVID